MTTGELMALQKLGELLMGAYTVDIKPGAYSDTMGSKVLVYTNSRPNSDILSFSVQEFILTIESAKTLSLTSFKSLILAKRMFGGTIQKKCEKL